MQDIVDTYRGIIADIITLASNPCIFTGGVCILLYDSL